MTVNPNNIGYTALKFSILGPIKYKAAILKIFHGNQCLTRYRNIFVTSSCHLFQLCYFMFYKSHRKCFQGDIITAVLIIVGAITFNYFDREKNMIF